MVVPLDDIEVEYDEDDFDNNWTYLDDNKDDEKAEVLHFAYNCILNFKSCLNPMILAATLTSPIKLIILLYNR